MRITKKIKEKIKGLKKDDREQETYAELKKDDIEFEKGLQKLEKLKKKMVR